MNSRENVCGNSKFPFFLQTSLKKYFFKTEKGGRGKKVKRYYTILPFIINKLLK